MTKNCQIAATVACCFQVTSLVHGVLVPLINGVFAPLLHGVHGDGTGVSAFQTSLENPLNKQRMSLWIGDRWVVYL